MILDCGYLRIQDHFSKIQDELETTDYESNISETTDYESNISETTDYESNISDYESEIQDELETTVRIFFCKFKSKLFFNLNNFWLILKFFFDKIYIYQKNVQKKN
jgi:hypothetical protein